MTEDLDIKLIKYMQDGLPLTKTPYKDIADGLGMTEDAVIERLKVLLENGKIRRLGLYSSQEDRHKFKCHDSMEGAE